MLYVYNCVNSQMPVPTVVSDQTLKVLTSFYLLPKLKIFVLNMKDLGVCFF